MIRGEKVTLRTVREADLDTLYDLWSDIQNRGEYYSLELPSQVEFKKRFQEHGLLEENNGTFLICASDKIIGTIFFFNVLYYNGLEIGYILFDTTGRNQGYMTEALSLLVKYLFASKKINRLQLTVIPGNIASKRVAEKCGFQFEGTVRGAIFHRGVHQDLELFSLLREEAKVS